MDPNYYRHFNEQSEPGLYLVRPPRNPRAPYTSDVILIHGVSGGPTKTWRHPESEQIWFRDFLPDELDDDRAGTNARIWTFGYNCNVVFNASRAETWDFAKSLLEDVRQIRIGYENLKIIWVCHSLGGIVLKTALIHASLSSSRYRPILEATTGILFLATPHRGSSVATVAAVAAKIAKKAIVIDPNCNLLKSLERDSQHLFETASSFTTIASDIKIFSFYEESTIARTIIVDSHSAVVGVPGEHSRPLHADHKSICKYKNRHDPNYIAVSSSLRELMTMTAVTTTISAVVSDTPSQRPHVQGVSGGEGFGGPDDNLNNRFAGMNMGGEMRPPPVAPPPGPPANPFLDPPAAHPHQTPIQDRNPFRNAMRHPQYMPPQQQQQPHQQYFYNATGYHYAQHQPMVPPPVAPLQPFPTGNSQYSNQGYEHPPWNPYAAPFYQQPPPVPQWPSPYPSMAPPPVPPKVSVPPDTTAAMPPGHQSPPQDSLPRPAPPAPVPPEAQTGAPAVANQPNQGPQPNTSNDTTPRTPRPAYVTSEDEEDTSPSPTLSQASTVCSRSTSYYHTGSELGRDQSVTRLDTTPRTASGTPARAGSPPRTTTTTSSVSGNTRVPPPSAANSTNQPKPTFRTQNTESVARVPPPPVSKTANETSVQVSTGWCCDVCGEGFAYGDRRVSCAECYDYDLCPACYNSGKTSGQHARGHSVRVVNKTLMYRGDGLEPVSGCPLRSGFRGGDNWIIEKGTNVRWIQLKQNPSHIRFLVQGIPVGTYGVKIVLVFEITDSVANSDVVPLKKGNMGTINIAIGKPAAKNTFYSQVISQTDGDLKSKVFETGTYEDVLVAPKNTAAQNAPERRWVKELWFDNQITIQGTGHGSVGVLLEWSQVRKFVTLDEAVAAVAVESISLHELEGKTSGRSSNAQSANQGTSLVEAFIANMFQQMAEEQAAEEEQELARAIILRVLEEKRRQEEQVTIQDILTGIARMQAAQRAAEQEEAEKQAKLAALRNLQAYVNAVERAKQQEEARERMAAGLIFSMFTQM